MLVRAQDVVVRLGKHDAVAGVDAQISEGVTGLLGVNGAGKTTLMRVLSTALPVTSGILTMLGAEVSRGTKTKDLQEVRRQIGYAPQQLVALKYLSVYDQVAYAAWLKDVPKRRVDEFVQSALDRVQLLDKKNSRVGALSGGMLRRLNVAMALVAKPSVVLLDEPTAGLDPEQRVVFRALVRDVGRDAAVVLSTHLVEDIAAACSRVLVLDAGKIAFDGPPPNLGGSGERSRRE